MGLVMTILHIISGLDDGGAEAVLFRLCQHYNPKQHHVISMSDEGKYGPLLKQLGVRVDILDMPRGRLTMRGLWKLFQLLRCSRANIVQTWMYHADLIGGTVARLAGKENVFWGIRHTTLDPEQSSRSAIIAARLSAWLSGVVPKTIICCAEEAVRVHADIGYNAKSMVVVPNGYDLDQFKLDTNKRKAIRNELGVDNSTPLLGFVARFNPQKDHANLIKALGILMRSGKSFHCILVGSGLDASNQSLVRQIDGEGLSLHVSLLGRRTDIPAVMNALDLHVMSSAFGEAFPNVLAEAMACGTPCISTNVGDASEIVGETGLIVPARNPDALAAAISKMLIAKENPAWEARCKAARRHVSENFSIDRMIKNYENIWFGPAA